MNNSDTPNSLPSFFSNPIVGFIGTVASIIGLFLSIYFYNIGLPYRNLLFIVHPIRTSIFNPKDSTVFKFTVNNKEVSTEVSSIQIALWNKGNLPIKRENVLKRIRLFFPDLVPILDTKILSFSREIINLKIGQQNADKGELVFDWDIFEPKDWAIIQLLIASGTMAKPNIDGIIEAQASLTKVDTPVHVKSPAEQFIEHTQYPTWKIFLNALAGGIFFILYDYFFKQKTMGRFEIIVYVILILFFSIFISFANSYFQFLEPDVLWPS